jgi:pSer/pThr/pTyr-binding forkhead associated (FHA) protein
MRKGPLPGKTFDLVKSLLTIGREVKNDIVVNDPEVSRQHVRLTEQPEGYWVEDLASTNGAFINGQRLAGPMALRPGDILGLGSTVEFEYSVQPGPDQTVAAGQPAGAAPEALPVNEPVHVPPLPSAAPDPAPGAAPLAASTPPPASAFPPPSAYPPPPAASVPLGAAGGFEMKPWMWAVAGGCALLALCGCGLVGLAIALGPQLGNLF